MQRRKPRYARGRGGNNTDHLTGETFIRESPLSVGLLYNNSETLPRQDGTEEIIRGGNLRYDNQGLACHKRHRKRGASSKKKLSL